MDISNRDVKHIARAIDLAQRSTMRSQHAAVVARGRKVVAMGINNVERVDTMRIGGSTHAEEDACARALRLSKEQCYTATVYVVRVDRCGVLKNSAPCIDCARMMRELGIGRVVYTNSSGDVVSERLNAYTTTHRSHCRKLKNGQVESRLPEVQSQKTAVDLELRCHPCHAGTT